MNFAKTLLAGAALCALATAPAMAAPNIHLKAAPMGAHALKIKSVSVGHAKTGIHDPSFTNYTVTFTLSGSLSRSYFFKKFVLLYAYDWTNGCTDVGTKEVFKSVPNLTAVHKIKAATTTGTCSGSPLVFHGPDYKLLSNSATFDSFTGALIAKKTSSGYNLRANIPTNLHIF